MTGKVIVDLSGDASRLQKAYDVAEKSDKSLRDSLANTGEVGQTAAETISREFDKSGDKSAKAMNQIIREMRKNGPEGRKVAEEVEKHWRETGKVGRKSMNDMVAAMGELDPESAEAANAMRRHITENAQAAEIKLTKMESPLERIKKKAMEAFGPGGIRSMTAYGAAVGGIGLGLKGLAAAFELLEEKQKSAVDSLLGQAEPEKRLAQIANSGKDLDNMLKKADELSLTYGMSREKSRNLMFSARSEKFEEDVEKIARYGTVVDVEAQAPLAGSLGRLFPKEGLDVTQRLSGVLAAAATSAFDFETVGASVRKSASASSDTGADMAETLAANATLANLIGESAGDRIKAFAGRLAINKDFGGRGIIGGVEALAAAPEKDRRKFLGESQELNEAFSLLSKEMPNLKEMTKAVREDIQATASGRGNLVQKVTNTEESERFQIRKMVRRSEVKKEIEEEERFAESGADVAAAENLIDAKLAERGTPVTSQALFNGIGGRLSLKGAMTQIGTATGLSPEETTGLVAGTVEGVGGVMTNTPTLGIPVLVEYLKKQNELTERSVKAQEKTAENTVPRSGTPDHRIPQRARANAAVQR